jgi:hypothetical protein
MKALCYCCADPDSAQHTVPDHRITAVTHSVLIASLTASLHCCIITDCNNTQVARNRFYDPLLQDDGLAVIITAVLPGSPAERGGMQSNGN